MSIIIRFAQLFRCQHSATYRERRLLHGASVMHLVCHDCGHASPAVQRSAGEHHRALRAGAVRLPRARRQAVPLVQVPHSLRQSA